jgi:glycosyltransferase involved in cell wall biosynthesis
VRICYLADASNIHTQRWVGFFADAGHDVHLLSHTPYTGTNGRITCHPLPVPNSLPLWTARVPKVRAVEHFFREWRAVWKQVERLNADVVHGHFVLGHGHRAYLSRRRPLVISAWGSDVFLYPLQPPFCRFLTRRTLRSADLVTCDSDDLRRSAVAIGADAGKTHVVHHGVDTELFRPLPDKAGLRRRLGFDPDAPLVLSPRTIRSHYNIDIIVRAFAQVRVAFPAARLILKDYYGWPDYRRSVEKLVEELGLSDRVTFIEHLPYEDMVKLYNAADVVVSLANTDSAPMSVLEAMVSGAAVVATDLPSVRDWIDEGANGYLAPARDGDAVAAQIMRALRRDGATAAEWARKNHALIQQRGDFRRHMENMGRLYEQLVSRK